MEADRSAPFAIVAFPALEPADKQWVESIRARYDPQVGKISAHFSLVFPTVLSLHMIEAQAMRVARTSEPIRFVLRRAAIVADAVGSGGHVFLMPEEGRDQLTQLHGRLYEGALQSHLRKEVSFTPHLTVAARAAIEPLNALAGEMNAKMRGIRGFISEITVVEVTPSAIEHIAQFQLGALR